MVHNPQVVDRSFDATARLTTGTGHAPMATSNAPIPGRTRTELRSIIEMVGAVAAPTTVLGGLALYFGVVYVNAQAFYFGIDGSTLGLSTQDYVLRSADALFVPLGALALAGIVLLSAHASFRRWSHRPGRARLARLATWGLSVVGLGLFGAGAISVFRPLPVTRPFLVAPLSLGAGAIASSYAVRMRRTFAGSAPVFVPVWARTTSAALVGAIAVSSLFWAASEYARALGRGRSATLEATLPFRPGVTVYSEQPLHVDGGGVRAAVIEMPGGQLTYRYDGLRLFIRAGGRYFLLPADWTPGAGRAFVLRDDERVRLDFTVGASS